VEIEKNETFKTDISLIGSLKERKEKSLAEIKEEPNILLKEEKTENNIKVGGLKVDKKTIENVKAKQIEEQQAEETKAKSYTIGELPNVFTPNGDGSNDFLFIESEGLEDFTIVVLDSKQRSIFESNDP